MGTDGAVLAQQGFAVFNTKNIVGRRKDRIHLLRKNKMSVTGRHIRDGRFCNITCQRTASCQRKTHSVTQVFLKKISVYRRFRNKNTSCFHKDLRIAAFASKTKFIYAPKSIQKTYAACGKALRTGSGNLDGKLQDKIGTAKKSHLRPEIFFHKRRCASLHKISAHGDDHIISTKSFSDITDLIFMPPVKRIVFCNNSNNFHIKNLPFPKS